MVQVLQNYITLGHPNRMGGKLRSVTALVFHYTNNDAPGATDTMNAAYFNRAWHRGADHTYKEWLTQWIKNPEGKLVPTQVEVDFRFGSAQVVVDEDSITETMPLDEVAWGCGDRRFEWTELNKGQQPASRIWFGNQPNERTLNLEICNNRSWSLAVGNSIDWAVDYLNKHSRSVSVKHSLFPQEMGTLDEGEVLLLRHYDVSGKLCPKPMIDDPKAWSDLVHQVAARVNA